MDLATLRAKHAALSPVWTERSRRVWATTEAQAIGYGGITQVARATGIAASTIQRGLCRKVAVAKLTGQPEIEIWGDGEQTRSFCYIDDCLEGVFRLMHSDHAEPLNVGQDRMVTINQLADIVSDIAGYGVRKRHIPGPQGVRRRNSDNTRLRAVLGWQPSLPLEEGLRRTYEWIESQVASSLRTSGTAPLAPEHSPR